MIIVWIIIAIIVFSLIIIIHEWGHFITARIFWVKVHEFGLGLPPKAKKLFTDKKWTEYTLNYLPLGGFVRLKWESQSTYKIYDINKVLIPLDRLQKILEAWQEVYDKNGNTIEKDEIQAILQLLKDESWDDSLSSKPIYQQSIIMLGGVFMNFVLGIFIFSLLFFIWVKPLGVNTVIETNTSSKIIPTYEKAYEMWLILQEPWVYLLPMTGSLAQQSGIQNYDLVLKVNGEDIRNQDTLKNIISQSPEQEVILEISRALEWCDISTQECTMKNIILSVTPDSEWKLGTYLFPNERINPDFRYKFGLIGSIQAGTQETYSQIILTFQWVKLIWQKIFAPKTPTERQEALDQVSGPIGIAHFMSISFTNGWIFMMIVWAVISINLWVFNLLPIPALDGGRFLLININGLIKKIFWFKIVPEAAEQILHIWFFILLIVLSVFVAYNDVNKIIN